jgi:hypothetical protein
VLSLVCSAIQELVAQALNLRAKVLAAGIRNLLGDDSLSDDFFDHARLKALSKPPRKLRPERGPSYIPSRVFALTLLDTLAPPAGEKSRDVVEVARKTLGDADAPERVKTMLADALEVAGERRDRLQAELERSFDHAMDRVSGWYKRRAQLLLLALAVALVGATNADSFALAERLWKDDALRAVTVGAATEAARQGSTTCPGATAGAPPQQRAAECLDAVDELALPLGWSNAPLPGGWAIIGKIVGLLVTVFALSLGAPFWFDLLSKVSRLRSSGPPAPPREEREADRPAPASP